MEKKKRWILGGMIIGFLAIGIGVFVYWIIIGRFYKTTDDAYVHGNQVIVTPQTAGFITAIMVEETDIVEEGRLLVTLDTTDNRLALERTESDLAQSVRTVIGLFQKVQELKAAKEMRNSEMIKAAQDYTHRKNLVTSGSVSKEDFEHSESFFVSAVAGVLFAEHRLKAAIAEVENTTVETHPLVDGAKEAYRRAWVNLRRCEVRAPTRGMIARRRGQVGEAVAQSDPLMEIVPLDQIWVEANYKEVHLKYVRIGQPVHVTADLWGGDVIFQGKVIGISAGTGSVFSVLPPQNATGNWIKIVQRLPVRVALDPEEIKHYPLRLGLSMKTTIDTHNRQGKLLPIPPPEKPLFETDIFKTQIQGAEEKITEIIKANSSFIND